MGSLSDGIIHPYLTTIHLYSIHLIPGLGRILNILKIDKRKATAATRVAIQNHLTFLHVSKLAEFLLQFSLGGVQAQSKHPQALVRLRFLPISMVPASVRHGGTGITALLQEEETKVHKNLSLEDYLPLLFHDSLIFLSLAVQI